MAKKAMLSDFMKRSVRRQITEQMIDARRQLRRQEQRLAQLKFEWGIVKRMRQRAHGEDEREKWRVESDAYMGLVLQQESAIKELKATIDEHKTRMSELDEPHAGEEKQIS